MIKLCLVPSMGFANAVMARVGIFPWSPARAAPGGPGS